jgi:DNA polymerase-3 subunit delta'
MRAPVVEDIPEADRLPDVAHPREARALYGQAGAERAFLDAWAAGRLHHAWMLAGPRGVGKATAAYRMARALLVHADAAPASLDVDPGHPVARRILARSEPRLKVAARDWDRKRKQHFTEITVDVVRGLKDFFQMSAADGGWRVAIVDPADELNRNAANALLKMLEEPPARAMFFLVAHAPGRLLPTIRSRCRVLDFAPLDAAALAAALRDAGVDASDAAALAELSAGAPGEAARLAAGGGAALYARLARLLGGAPGLDRRAMIALADACAGRDAAPRYDMTLRLTATLLHRLARAGAGATQAEATLGEARLAARLCPDARRARLWAEAAATVEARAARARAVNLDPAHAILDIWLEIDAVAARAAGR